VTGVWLTAVARYLTREESYRLTVSPAIADLQFEAGTRHGLRRWIRYVGVWRAIGGAVYADTRHGLGLAFGPDVRTAWRMAGVVYAVLLTLTIYFVLPSGFGLDLLGVDGYAAVLALRLPAAMARCLPVILLPIAVVFARRLEDATRPILLTATLVSVVVVIGSFTLVVPATRTADQYFQAAVWRGRMETAEPPRSLDAVRRDLTVPLARPDQLRARRENNNFLRHDIAARGTSTFAFALIGLGFARKRGWRACLWVAGAWLAWGAVIGGTMELYASGLFPRGLPVGLLSWTQTAALFAVGLLALTVRRWDDTHRPAKVCA